MGIDCYICHYRWRRTVPFLVFVITVLLIHLYGVSIRDAHFIESTLKTLKSFGQQKSAPKTPLHVLLVSYARTGSSFVGDLLQSLPSTFYYFEPLHFLGNAVFNDSLAEARELLNDVFTCNASQIPDFMKWQEIHKKAYMKLRRSFKYWQDCQKKRTKKKDPCFSGSYIDAYCSKHKIVIVKSIRLKLTDAAKLFQTHPHLNLKVIYLIRDPRGSISSRKKAPISLWCKMDPMCFDPTHFCNVLESDLGVACRLMQEHPEDFMVVRYDDLALNPYPTTERLVRFLGFSEIGEETKNFLKTHTSVLGNDKRKTIVQGVAYPYSTYRNSSITATSWRRTMPFKSVMILQQKCMTSLQGFGYHFYKTRGSLKSNINFDTNLERALTTSCKSPS